MRAAGERAAAASAPGGAPARTGPASLAAAVLLHPRHVVLAGVVAGLLAGPRAASLVVALAAVAVGAGVAGRRRAGPELVPLRRRVRGTPEVGVVAVPVPVARPVLGLLVALGVVAGAAVAGERLRALDRTALVPAAEATVRGFVAEPARVRARRVRVVAVRLGEGPGGGERVLVRARAHVGWPEAEVGEELVARGELRALRAHEGFERRRGVHAVLEADRVTATGRRRASALDAARRRAERRLGAGLPPEAAALARGMVLGQDAALPADLRDAFRTAGLAHLLAASGQNVMLLAALVLALATAAGAGLRARLALALVAVALYVPLAGAGPSIQRAGVMGAAGLIAALAGRPASRWYALLLAALVTLVLDPRAAEDPGWQLSFAAVVAILALHGRLRGALVARRTPAALADAAALTVAATLGTAPLLALHFEAVSLVSLPANLLATPAVAPVMWLGTLAALLGGPPGALLTAVAAYPLAYLAWLGRAAAAVPGASVAVALPGPLAAVALYAAGAAAVALALRASARRAASASGGEAAALRPRRLARRHLAAAAAVVAVAAVLVTRPVSGPAPPGPAVSLLDVGQGDAILLQDRGHAVLVDTGPPGSGLLGELRALGVRRLDAVLVTHSSSDHEGGLADVLGAVPVGVVLDGRQLPAERAAALGGGGEGGGGRFAGLPAGQPRAVPHAGQLVRAGPLALEVLWPPPDRPRGGDPNLTATVALARVGRLAVLLTADAESPVTLGLDLPDVDVLKVAHHGSADPGLPALLERTRPEVALVPVGADNDYGHPTAPTLGALRAVPVVARTDRDGTVTVLDRGGRPELR